ncbi:hypothetical protein GCM10009834_17710 [Streptomonospora arabica]
MPGRLCCAGAPPSPTAPDTPCTVDAVNPVLPVPPEAAELLDSTGRRMRERTPQRTPFTRGVWVREGRTGYDSAYLLAAGSAGFGARLGRGFGRAPGRATTAAPPNAPSTPGSRRKASASRCSRQGALEPGAASTPSWQYASHSDAGPRPPPPARPRQPPRIAATRGQHLDRLREPADAAPSVGVKRFVLHDDWFGGPRADARGPGDRYVSPRPGGLNPLAARVPGPGMELGISVKPEMVDEDSELARAHPDGIMAPRPGARLRGRARSQRCSASADRRPGAPPSSGWTRRSPSTPSPTWSGRPQPRVPHPVSGAAPPRGPRGAGGTGRRRSAAPV